MDNTKTKTTVFDMSRAKADYVGLQFFARQLNLRDVLVIALSCISYTLATQLEDEIPGFTCLRDAVGTRYKGSITRAKNNEKCLSWKSIMENPAYTNTIKTKIKDVYDSWPEYEKLSSKCRNPDKNTNGPWCFTERSSNDVVVTSCQISLCVASPNIGCLQHHRGTCYRGSENQVKLFDGTVHTCTPWSTVMESKGPKLNSIVKDIQQVYKNWSIVEQESNACRNPDRRSDGPWCFLYENRTHGAYASVQSCDIPLCNIKPRNTCFIDQFGYYYTGPHNVTKDGEPCSTWSSVMTDSVFDEYDIVEKIKFKYTSWSQEEKRSNACKNPDNRKHGPWCFVRRNNRTLEQVTCDLQLPECHEIKPRDLLIKMSPRMMTLKGQDVRVTCSAYVGEKCDLEAKGTIAFQLLNTDGEKGNIPDARSGKLEYDSVTKRISMQVVFSGGEHLAGTKVVCAVRMASYESSIATSVLKFRAIRVINSTRIDEEAVQDQASHSGERPVETLIHEVDISHSVKKVIRNGTSNEKRNQKRFGASVVDSADSFHSVRAVATLVLYLIIVAVVGRE